MLNFLKNKKENTDLLFPIQKNWKITVGWDQMRPLSVPPDQRTHPHAAWDVAAPASTEVVAPEGGKVVYLFAVRPDSTHALSEIKSLPTKPFDLKGHNYFYDVYGTVAILLADSGRTHIFCHAWANQLFDKAPFKIRWQFEEAPDTGDLETDRRLPFAFHNFFSPRIVQRGELITYVGSGGYSTGPHIHWELHEGQSWQSHAERPRLENFFPTEWSKKSS